MYWLNWWTFSSTHFLMAEAVPVISSQLVPDESVGAFRGELQTQWLNQSRDVSKLRNTAPQHPLLGTTCVYTFKRKEAFY